MSGRAARARRRPGPPRLSLPPARPRPVATPLTRAMYPGTGRRPILEIGRLGDIARPGAAQTQGQRGTETAVASRDAAQSPKSRRGSGGGGDRSRTGDGGFADLCLTTWLRRPAKQAYQARPADDRARRRRPPPRPEGGLERVKGLEPSTFCMASRRSSRLSYTRSEWGCYQRAPGGAIRRFAGDRPAACPRISAWRRRSPG